MTDNMTVKEALAVVIVAANEEAETCDVQFATRHAETIRQAINVLRNGSAKVERSVEMLACKCRWCEHVNRYTELGDQCRTCGRLLHEQKTFIEKWTEHTIMRPMEIRGKPAFTRVEE